MIFNKNETSIPSAGQITSHENPHIKIGQKTQFMMSHKYLEFNCVFVVIYNEKKLCRGPPRYWEWTSAWIKPCLSWIKWSILLVQDNLQRQKLTWHGLMGWINICPMSRYLQLDIFTLGVTWDHHNRQTVTLSPVLTHDGAELSVTNNWHLFIVPTTHPEVTTCIIAMAMYTRSKYHAGIWLS